MNISVGALAARWHVGAWYPGRKAAGSGCSRRFNVGLT